MLDIADLFRDSVLMPSAFRVAKEAMRRPHESVERLARRETGAALRKGNTVPKMIARIKRLFEDSGA